MHKKKLPLISASLAAVCLLTGLGVFPLLKPNMPPPGPVSATTHVPHSSIHAPPSSMPPTIMGLPQSYTPVEKEALPPAVDPDLPAYIPAYPYPDKQVASIAAACPTQPLYYVEALDLPPNYPDTFPIVVTYTDGTTYRLPRWDYGNMMLGSDFWYKVDMDPWYDANRGGVQTGTIRYMDRNIKPYEWPKATVSYSFEKQSLSAYIGGFEHIPLLLDAPAVIDLDLQAGDEAAVYVFTPTEDGRYSFIASHRQRGTGHDGFLFDASLRAAAPYMKTMFYLGGPLSTHYETDGFLNDAPLAVTVDARAGEPTYFITTTKRSEWVHFRLTVRKMPPLPEYAERVVKLEVLVPEEPFVNNFIRGGEDHFSLTPYPVRLTYADGSSTVISEWYNYGVYDDTQPRVFSGVFWGDYVWDEYTGTMHYSLFYDDPYYRDTYPYPRRDEDAYDYVGYLSALPGCIAEKRSVKEKIQLRCITD